MLSSIVPQGTRTFLRSGRSVRPGAGQQRCARVFSASWSTQAKQEEKDENNTSNDSENSLRLDILNAALTHVPELGWTVKALAAGAEDVGLPPVSHGIVERGAIELVEHFSTTTTSEVVQSAEQYFGETEEHIGMTDRIKYVTRKRLEAIAPYTNTWPEAMALGALPQNAAHTLESVANTVDSLWKVCGDHSEGTSWLTKRSLLSGIYVSTELYMLTDTSIEYEDTWNYLDRQIDTVVSIGKVVGDGTSKQGTSGHGLPGSGLLQGEDLQAVASVVGANASTLFSTMTTMFSHAISEKGSEKPPSSKAAAPEKPPSSKAAAPEKPPSSQAATHEDIDEDTKKLIEDLENDPFFNGAPFEEGLIY